MYVTEKEERHTSRKRRGNKRLRTVNKLNVTQSWRDSFYFGETIQFAKSRLFNVWKIVMDEINNLLKVKSFESIGSRSYRRIRIWNLELILISNIILYISKRIKSLFKKNSIIFLIVRSGIGNFRPAGQVRSAG